MWWFVMIGLTVLTAGQHGKKVETMEPRFVTYEGSLQYGLNIAPPWKDGGVLEVNLPEHLERYPDTQGILRHSDRGTPRWRVTADGTQAVLDLDSATMPGIHVKGVGRVVSASRVELRMEITNHTDQTLPGIVPLYCFHYRTLTGFPQWLENFAHTYVLMGGKLIPMSAVPTENPQADVKGGYIRGNPQRDSDKFPSSRGGLIREPFDRGIIAVTALDEKRKVLVAWSPAKSILANAAIPCMHADPYYGPIAPGKSVLRQGVVVFTQESLERAVKRLVREGWGAPAQ